MELSVLKCTACRAGEPPATDAEVREYMAELPEWKLAAGRPAEDRRRNPSRITRKFPFAGFSDALLFTAQVGALAESEDHHPEIVTAWGRVTVSWWTHAVGGLHRNDFVMAAKTDDLYRSFETGGDVDDGPD